MPEEFDHNFPFFSSWEGLLTAAIPLQGGEDLRICLKNLITN